MMRESVDGCLDAQVDGLSGIGSRTSAQKECSVMKEALAQATAAKKSFLVTCQAAVRGFCKPP